MSSSVPRLCQDTVFLLSFPTHCYCLTFSNAFRKPTLTPSSYRDSPVSAPVTCPHHCDIVSGQQPWVTRLPESPTETGRNMGLAPRLRREAPGGSVLSLRTGPRGRSLLALWSLSRRDRSLSLHHLKPRKTSPGYEHSQAFSVATQSRKSWRGATNGPSHLVPRCRRK